MSYLVYEPGNPASGSPERVVEGLNGEALSAFLEGFYFGSHGAVKFADGVPESVQTRLKFRAQQVGAEKLETLLKRTGILHYDPAALKKSES